ncbi:MAG: flagellar biosynthesis repressor FlbT [Parvularculaceae bacterium]
MSGLILKLRPREQLMINGVVVENGDRKTRLRIRSEDARVLRLRDAIRPEDATTPARRALYAAQCAVAGELDDGDARAILEKALAALAVDFPDPPESAALEKASFHLRHGQFYLVMRQLREVAASEALKRGTAPVSDESSGGA